MINLNKGVSTPIAITIIIVLVVLIGGGVLGYQYYWLPKQEAPKTETPKDETVGWKIYRSEEHGFEIRYPNNTYIGDLIDIPRGKSITFSPSSTEGILEIKIFTENPRCSTALGSNIYNVLINGVSFMKQHASKNYSVVYPYAVAFEYCGIAANGVEYRLVPRIHYTKDPTNDANFVLPDVDNDPVLNQMLSTFRFIQ